MNIKKIIFGVLQILVVFIIGLYIESIASKDLLLTKGVLDDGLRLKILENPIKVLVFLGLLNVIFFILSHGLKENREIRNMYNNICQLVFDQYIKPSTTIENSKYRVSFFKAKKGLIFRRDNWFIPEYRTYLKNVGRYQTKQEMKLSRIKFLPGEGAVGKCFVIGEISKDRIPKYQSTQNDEFLNNHLSKLNLPLYKTKKLQDKSVSFLSCPIKYFMTDDIYGVIVIDSLLTTGVDGVSFRKIEDTVANYSVFFNSNNDK